MASALWELRERKVMEAQHFLSELLGRATQARTRRMEAAAREAELRAVVARLQAAIAELAGRSASYEAWGLQALATGHSAALLKSIPAACVADLRRSRQELERERAATTESARHALEWIARVATTWSDLASGRAASERQAIALKQATELAELRAMEQGAATVDARSRWAAALELCHRERSALLQVAATEEALHAARRQAEDLAEKAQAAAIKLRADCDEQLRVRDDLLRRITLLKHSLPALERQAAEVQSRVRENARRRAT